MRSNSLKIWVNIAILNLCIVASLGVLMRSKMLFDMPWIDYNRLIETHGNFAFTGWVSLILLALFVFELSGSLYKGTIYGWLLSGMALCSWATLFTTPFAATHHFSEYISLLYILLTYVFAWRFISGIRKIVANKAIVMLSVSAILCLVLSSAGTIMLACLFSAKSLNAILYRDALFGYLHLQYNGFFTLAVFAIIFNKIDKKVTDKIRRRIYVFSMLLCLSILPSMFITFLWHDTNIAYHIVSIIGSLLLFSSLIAFLLTVFSLRHGFILLKPVIRFLIFSSMAFFALKLLLQSLTIITPVNIFVFGDRPVIMGFLHLVFLGFVTLFIIAYLAQKGLLNITKSFTRFALLVFTIAVILNELLLMTQGLSELFVIGTTFFPLLLWYVGILLLAGSLLVAISRSSSGSLSR